MEFNLLIDFWKSKINNLKNKSYEFNKKKRGQLAANCFR